MARYTTFYSRIMVFIPNVVHAGGCGWGSLDIVPPPLGSAEGPPGACGAAGAAGTTNIATRTVGHYNIRYREVWQQAISRKLIHRFGSNFAQKSEKNQKEEWCNRNWGLSGSFLSYGPKRLKKGQKSPYIFFKNRKKIFLKILQTLDWCQLIDNRFIFNLRPRTIRKKIWNYFFWNFF